MELLRRFGAWFARHFFPSEANSYRPNSLSRDVLAVAVTLTCVIEGFLVASLFIHTKPGSFTAAVIESAIISLTNEERVHYGDAVLRVDPILTLAAQAKANDMAARGYFSHVGPSGEQPWKWFTDAGYEYAYAGENLATKFYESSDVVDAWMNSPGHRANILKGVYQDIGVGIAHGMYQGQETTFVVQFFGTTRAALGIAPAAAPSVVPVAVASEKPKPQPTLAEVTSPVVAPAEVPVAIQAPAVEGQSVSTVARPQLPSSIARFLASPRTIALFMLGSIIAFLLIAIFFAVFIRVHIQPTDLLLNGIVVAVFTLILFSANIYFLSGVELTTEPAAAVTVLHQ